MWVGKAGAQTLSRWTPLQSSDGVTGWGNRRSSRLEDPTSHWQQTCLCKSRTITIPLLADRARNFTLDLSGCRAGGEEEGGSEGSRERRRKEARGAGAAQVKQKLAYKTALAVV